VFRRGTDSCAHNVPSHPRPNADAIDDVTSIIISSCGSEYPRTDTRTDDAGSDFDVSNQCPNRVANLIAAKRWHRHSVDGVTDGTTVIPLPGSSTNCFSNGCTQYATNIGVTNEITNAITCHISLVQSVRRTNATANTLSDGWTITASRVSHIHPDKRGRSHRAHNRAHSTNPSTYSELRSVCSNTDQRTNFFADVRHFAGCRRFE
jgi:hypothetical protein